MGARGDRRDDHDHFDDHDRDSLHGDGADVGGDGGGGREAGHAEEGAAGARVGGGMLGRGDTLKFTDVNEEKDKIDDDLLGDMGRAWGGRGVMHSQRQGRATCLGAGAEGLGVRGQSGV